MSSVVKQAKAMGVDVYVAEHDVRPGESLATKVKELIQVSDAMVVLLTPHGLSAPYVQQEIGFAGCPSWNVNGTGVKPPRVSFVIDQSPAKTAALVGGSGILVKAFSSIFPATHPIVWGPGSAPLARSRKAR